jgi:hypothetical protein
LFNQTFFLGIFGMAWFVVWWFLSSESPAASKSISNEERLYIESTLTANTSAVPNKVRLKTNLSTSNKTCQSVESY